jgi:hypothetical protein
MRASNRTAAARLVLVEAAAKLARISAQLVSGIPASANSDSMPLRVSARSSGELVAAALAGCWRADPYRLELSAIEFASITPLLLQSGAGALSWRRVRNSHLAETSSGKELQQAYRLHAIQAALHETNIKQVLELLRAAGVEPVLAKGWAIARSYPEIGLRPYGDLDFCVAPNEFADAKAALTEAGDRYPVDLHWGLRMLDYQDWDELFQRSQLVPLDETLVRVFAPEDHLRLLCFHLLRHGVERPIGLVDIAVALEGRCNKFDWPTCLGSDRKHADWIITSIGLAGELLGADVRNVPFSVKQRQPSWIVNAVLKAWGRSFANHFSQAAPLKFYRHHPRGLAKALAARWPTPIIGTIGVGGSFNRLPRFPYQLGYLLLRSLRFLKQVS